MEPILLTVAGSVIALLLAVCAFFLVRLVSRIDQMDGKLNGIPVQLVSHEMKLQHLAEDVRTLKERYRDISGFLSRSGFRPRGNGDT